VYNQRRFFPWWIYGVKCAPRVPSMFPVQHFWPVLFTNFGQVLLVAFFFCGATVEFEPGTLIVEVSRSSHTLSRTLKEWTARRTGSYIHNTQPTQEKNIHILSIIRNHRPRNRLTAELLMFNFIKNLNNLICRIQSNGSCATFGAAL